MGMMGVASTGPPMRSRERTAWAIAAISVLIAAWTALAPQPERWSPRSPAAAACPYEWHGGSDPSAQGGAAPRGSCWCGAGDGYCLCTPSLAIDLVIEAPLADGSGEEGVVLVRRRDNGLWATMGGFVNVGETTEATHICHSLFNR